MIQLARLSVIVCGRRMCASNDKSSPSGS